jgi:hypothetical protein
MVRIKLCAGFPSLGQRGPSAGTTRLSVLNQLSLESGFCRQSSYHISIPSIIAGAANNADPPSARPLFAQNTVGTKAGAVHQCPRSGPCAEHSLFYAPNLFGGVELRGQ